MLQAVAIHPLQNEYVIIVSEPPPHVTENDLRALLPGVELKRHKIGADGWVTDAVATLKLSNEGIQDKVADLHRLLFATTYGARVIELPAKPQLTLDRPDLDIHLAADDLSSWILGQDGAAGAKTFVPVLGGDPVTFAQIRETESLVYASQPAGLIAWWLPEGCAVEACPAEARQFTVESDLILGAVGDARGVMIIGRL